MPADAALCVAQLLAAHQGDGALLAVGDGVAGEHLAHHARPRIRWGPRPALGRGWLLPGKSVAEQFQQHQRLIDGAHAHPLGDELAQALVGGGRGRACRAGVRVGLTCCKPWSAPIQVSSGSVRRLAVCRFGLGSFVQWPAPQPSKRASPSP